MGVSTWDDQTGEELRHLVGNAVMEHVFSEYEYKCILKKGKHEINGEEIELQEDLWDCVKKDSKPEFLLKDNQVQLKAERKFLPGYEAPAAAYQTVAFIQTEKFKKMVFQVLKGLLILLLAAVTAVLSRILYVYYRREQRRRRRRHRKRRKK